MGLVTLNIRKPTYNVEPQAKVLSIDSARDCYYEGSVTTAYVLRRRPGRSLFCDLGAADVWSGGVLRTGQGIFWSDRFDAAFAVAGGKLYRLASGGTATEMVGGPLNTGQYITFAEGQQLDTTPFLYVAHGGVLRYTDGVTLMTPSDPNTPTAATFVTWLNGRVWANNGGQDFWITSTDPATGLLDPFYWSMTGNPWRATIHPDQLQVLHAAWNEVAAWGTRSLEYWQEDGVNPISPLVGATTEAGILAPYSLVQANETLFALASVGGKRAVIRLENRSPRIVSEGIDTELQKLTTVSDAVGVSIFVGGVNMYVLNFPTENKTWAYDLKEDLWTEWGTWNTSLAQYDTFPVAGSCYAKTWNKHLVLGQNGKVYVMSRDVYQDDGSEIRTNIRTGWINHNTYRRKRSNRLLIKLKTYSPTPGAVMSVRWRSDGRPEWSPYQTLAVGSDAAETQFAFIDRMGIYRSRQYEFLMTDNADMALCGIQEEVEELSS